MSSSRRRPPAFPGSAAWIRAGELVHYHPVIGEGYDGRIYRVRTNPELLSGHSWVVWLEGKAGCVAIEALSPVPPCAQVSPVTAGAPFPALCPACGAPCVDESWTDPVTHVVHERTVRHRGDCRIYRQRDFDRSELVAHLLHVPTEGELVA